MSHSRLLEWPTLFRILWFLWHSVNKSVKVLISAVCVPEGKRGCSLRRRWWTSAEQPFGDTLGGRKQHSPRKTPDPKASCPRLKSWTTSSRGEGSHCPLWLTGLLYRAQRRRMVYTTHKEPWVPGFYVDGGTESHVNAMRWSQTHPLPCFLSRGYIYGIVYRDIDVTAVWKY